MWTKLRAWCAAANTSFPEQSSGEAWCLSTISGALFVTLLYAVSRVFWYVRDGALGFGYDTGIYRHIIQGYWDDRGQHLQAFGFARITNVLRWTGISTDAILIGGYMVSAVLLVWAVYLVLQKQINRRAGLVGVFMVTVSLTQIEFYHWFYYRNLLAASLVLLAIAHRDRPWVSGLWLGLVGIIHPLSLVPIALAFGIWALCKKDRFTLILKMLGFAALITLIGNWSEWLLYVQPLWQYRGLASTAVMSAPEFNGQFITVRQWLGWSWPYLILAAPGVWLTRRVLAPLWWLAILAGLGIAAQVLFYRRLIVWLDLAAIISASAAIEYAWQRWRLNWAVCMFGIIGLFYGSRALVHYKPAMSLVDWLSLQQLNTLPAKSLIMTITPQYAPWLYGYTTQRIIAPGMLDENIWNRARWELFWGTREPAERATLLSQYPAPHVYIFLTQSQSQFGLLLGADSNFVPLSSQVWQFNNPNYPQKKNINE